MTQPERDAFAVAFVLLLVEHFFAPGPVGWRGKVNEEVFHAVANPSEVRLYDWAEYVLKEFRRSAGSVERQLTSGYSKISLSGCLLFLQIFYLDRLDLETTNWKVPRDVLPRVAAYDCDSIYDAIDLDRQTEWPEGGLKQFGKLKFAVKQAAQTDGFGSAAKGPQPSLHFCNSEHHDSTKNADMQSIVHHATEGTGTTAPRVQPEFRPKELLNNQQPVTQQGVPSKKRNRSNFDDMIKQASLSTEKKPTGQVPSCQTNWDNPKVINFGRNTSVSSTLGSCPANPAPWSGYVDASANLKPRTTQEVPLERTSPLELADRNGARCESHPEVCCACRVQSRSNPKEIFINRQPETQQEVASEKRNQPEFLIREENSHHMKQEACKSHVEAEKKPLAQMSSCQTTSDSSDDCVIVHSFRPKNAAPWAQSRSNPKDVFSNLHPRTKQEVPSEKIRQTEFEVREGTQCDTYQNKFAAASSCPEEKPVTQGTACQITPKDVIVLDSESDTECTPSCSGPEIKKEYTFGRSPFEMGLVHPTPPKQAEACFKWLEACSYQDDQLNWTWVILEEPNSIAVNGLSIKLQMTRGAVLKQDVCNLVMHLYRQLDDEIYQNSGNAEPRWRHFLPAHPSALEHGDKICDESSPTVKSMFTGAHIPYDVGLCRMVIAPVELDGSWSCYVWDFMEKQLNILDPLLRRSRSRNRNRRKEEAIKMKHSSSAPQLLSALLVCISLYCNSHGYDHQESSPNSWKTEFLHDFEGMRSRCEPNTGMYTLFYAREFDGKGLRQTVSERTIEKLRRDLLHQMLTMRGNTGRPPLIVHYPAKCPPEC